MVKFLFLLAISIYFTFGCSSRQEQSPKIDCTDVFEIDTAFFVFLEPNTYIRIDSIKNGFCILEDRYGDIPHYCITLDKNHCLMQVIGFKENQIRLIGNYCFDGQVKIDTNVFDEYGNRASNLTTIYPIKEGIWTFFDNYGILEKFEIYSNGKLIKTFKPYCENTFFYQEFRNVRKKIE